MARRSQSLPKFEDFRAPWEDDKDGKEIPEDEQEIDKGRLKRLIFDLRSDKATLQQTNDSLTTDLSEARKESETKEREGETEVQRLQRENDTLKADQTASKASTLRESAEDHLTEQYPHLTLKQVRRLARKAEGESEQDVHESLDDLISDLGLDKPAEGESEREERTPHRRQPQSRRRAGGERNDDDDEDPGPKAPSLDDILPRQF